ncbi:MAG: hypothetical protein M3R29_05730 [Verrucomicrobiota bacterium]|nr:hypothetical protein [Verrucomicrobiota bacterium]
MNRSVIIAALIVSGAILLNGYLDRTSSRPSGHAVVTKKASSQRNSSIAVLPFENMSEAGDTVLADDVYQQIVADLAKIPDLKVISPTLVMQYRGRATRNLREIVEKLGVAHVLEGSVLRAGDRIRVNVQLVEATTDKHLWAQTYDRDIKELPALVSEILREIVEVLRAGRT